ncbi:MAG: flagellin [Defluviitaleaceae bacterium]|nr:flagellin [Defluviitaleaceae bacterium]
MSMTVNSTSQIQNLSQQIGSGRQINSAADNAAGLGIAERMSAQERGFQQGTRNTADMQSLVRTAEGALSSINSSLQRINELALQASNGIMTASDRALIQNEVSQLLDQIQSVSEQTQFNTRNLLDGTATDLHTASSPDGSGMSVSIPGMSLSDLGIEGFDVTGNFDLSAIHNAMNTVNAARSNLGAMSNRMDYVMTSNDISSMNLAASRSRIEDTDMARATMELERERLLEQYQLAAQQREQERLEDQSQRLFTF